MPSFRLGFQPGQMSIELVFRDARASVELLDAAPYFCVYGIAIFGEPAILFLLGFQQAEQDFFNSARAGCLKLLLDPGFQIRITDFDGHGFHLAPKPHDSFSS